MPAHSATILATRKAQIKASGGVFITYATMSRLLQDVPSPNNGFCFCTGNVWHGEGEKIYDIRPKLASMRAVQQLM